MQEELLISIGHLYVEASRLRSLSQQMQETIQKQQDELGQLRAQLALVHQQQSGTPPNAPTAQR